MSAEARNYFKTPANVWIPVSAANPMPVVQTGTPTLPTGAATETTLAAASAKLPAALGQGTKAQGLRVVLPSDQDTLAVKRDGQAAASTTIATGAGTASAEIDLGAGNTSFGFILPVGWVTSDITFQVSDQSGGTYVDLYNDSGTKLTIAAAQASRAYGLEGIAGALFPWRFVKLVSVTSQGSTRTVKIIAKG